MFIWAATACRFVQEGGPHARSRLNMLVNRRVSAAATGPERKLDDIYTGVLRSALREGWTSDEKEQFCHLLNDTLGTIAVSFLSLSASGLAALLSCSEQDIVDVLCNLHSIVDVPYGRSEPIRPHHASVRDFILSSQRCTDARFWVDERRAHTHIARQSLLLMTRTLKKDICCLKQPGVLMRDIGRGRINACVSPSLRYACLYWAQHVERSHSLATLQNPINGFMREHFLHWLEVLALVGKLSDGLQVVALLDTLFVSLPSLPASAVPKLTSTVARRKVASGFYNCGCQTVCALQPSHDREGAAPVVCFSHRFRANEKRSGPMLFGPAAAMAMPTSHC